MRTQTKLYGRFIASAMIVVGIAMATTAPAQEEVSKGSSLRKNLFGLARPHIERQAGQKVLFEGSLKQLNGWAFFLGSIVNGNGSTIRIGDSESGDTAILWEKRGADWVVVEAECGFTDVFYLDWPQKHGVPRSLLGL